MVFKTNFNRTGEFYPKFLCSNLTYFCRFCTFFVEVLCNIFQSVSFSNDDFDTSLENNI